MKLGIPEVWETLLRARTDSRNHILSVHIPCAAFLLRFCDARTLLISVSHGIGQNH